MCFYSLLYAFRYRYTVKKFFSTPQDKNSSFRFFHVTEYLYLFFEKYLGEI